MKPTTIAASITAAVAVGYYATRRQANQPAQTAPINTGGIAMPEQTIQPVPAQPAKTAAPDNRPRGIRNNNPLNMRDYGITWQGNIGRDPQGFEVFDTAANGLRAAGNDLKNKWLNGTRTIGEIISIWAPVSGQAQSGAVYSNPTSGYIDYVAKQSGINADKELTDFDQYVAVVMAMIMKENGQNPYTRTYVASALKSGFAHGKALPVYFGGMV